jgi:cyanate permease
MDAEPGAALATHRRLRYALMAAGVLAIAGWVGLWFRGEDRSIAYAVWGVGNGSATILAITLALMRCPRCGRRGFASYTGWAACRYCGFTQKQAS